MRALKQYCGTITIDGKQTPCKVLADSNKEALKIVQDVDPSITANQLVSYWDKNPVEGNNSKGLVVREVLVKRKGKWEPVWYKDFIPAKTDPNGPEAQWVKKKLEEGLGLEVEISIEYTNTILYTIKTPTGIGIGYTSLLFIQHPNKHARYSCLGPYSSLFLSINEEIIALKKKITTEFREKFGD